MADASPPQDEPLLVLDELSDNLQAFRLLRKSDEAAADEVLDRLGASGPVEAQIVFEMAAVRPLWIPERFEEAHRLVMHSLEVLDRNGGRPARLPRLGPLKVPTSAFVQLVTRLIVKSHCRSVIEALRRLYGRREASCPPGSPDGLMLRRARSQAERLTPGYSGKGIAIPTFLAGGLVASVGASLLQTAGDLLERQGLFLAVATAALFLLFLGAAWGVLRAAAVARRRSRLTLDQPLRALWQTIGAAGDPPRDQSRVFALAAIGLSSVALLLVPAAVTYAIAT
ncbi:MAG: hypothetical protein IPM45_00445 [Acidimicrobiales bacterium]|nr:hypothetical protein [Acidimicrobiales bacterium]